MSSPTVRVAAARSPDRPTAHQLTFIAAHRAELESGVPLSLDRPDIPVDLLPAGWVLNRRGRPDWPPR